MQSGRALRSKQLNRSNQKLKNNSERERRRRENLYYNYGKSGYQARECNTPPKELYIININEKRTGIVVKKADTTIESR